MLLTLYCSKCGEENNNESTYCRNCGAPLHKNDKAKVVFDEKITHLQLGIIVLLIVVIGTLVVGFLTYSYANTTYESENFTCSYPMFGSVNNNGATGYADFYSVDNKYIGSISVFYDAELVNTSLTDWSQSNSQTQVNSATNVRVNGDPGYKIQESSLVDGTNSTVYIFNHNNKTVRIVLNSNNKDSQHLFESFKLK